MGEPPSRAEIQRAIEEAIVRHENAKTEGGTRNMDNVGEMNAEIAGQKLNLKNAPVNTMATIATLILVILCLYVLWSHQQDARDASAAFVTAIREQTTVQKEQTIVMREANCLQSYQGMPSDKQAFCKQIAR